MYTFEQYLNEKEVTSKQILKKLNVFSDEYDIIHADGADFKVSFKHIVFESNKNSVVIENTKTNKTKKFDINDVVTKIKDNSFWSYCIDDVEMYNIVGTWLFSVLKTKDIVDWVSPKNEKDYLESQDITNWHNGELALELCDDYIITFEYDVDCDVNRHKWVQLRDVKLNRVTVSLENDERVILREYNDNDARKNFDIMDILVDYLNKYDYDFDDGDDGDDVDYGEQEGYNWN